MILRTLLAAIVAMIFFYGYYKYSKAPKPQRKKILIQWGSSLLVVVLLLLVAFGKMHWIGAVFAALIPVFRSLFPLLIRAFPFLLQNYKRKNTSKVKPGNTSQVKTLFLILTLDHDSGEISGEIIDGLFKSRTLVSLSLDEIKQLLSYYKTNDNESFRLLMAYVQRSFPDESFENDEEPQETPSSQSHMNKREALEILGLTDKASKEEIIAAHKKLIQRLHPDRGGSNYLAAKVNEAKDLLLKEC